MKKMYPAIVNSPKTELAGAITQLQTDISVIDSSVLLPGEGIATIGNGDTAETITYTSVEGNTLKGCVRGYQGTARAWTSGTRIARNFAAADWDAARENITELVDRLDTLKRSSITLQPGIQVVQADQDSPFSLTGLTGRTLVNLLGRAGGCGSITGWTKSTSASIELSTTNVNSGSKNIKVTQGGTAGPIYVRTPASATANVDPSKYYIAVAWIKNETAQAFSARLVSADGSSAINGAKAGTILAGGTGLVWRAYTPTEMSSNTKADMDVYTAGAVAVGAVFYVDSYRIYQISADEYSALQTDMTSDQLVSKYPYVDSVQPVRNPYAIRYGENLLPPFYEWNVNTIGISKVVSPYESVAEITSAGTISPLRTVIPVLPNTTYTISSEGASVSNGVQIIERKDSNDADSSGEISGGYFDNVPGKVAVGTVTFTTSEQTRYLAIRLRYDAVRTHTIKNPMLTIGTTAKPFKPREDPMLALQTELYADPITGANADEVFEKDGQYFKLAKWKRYALDDSLSYAFLNNYVGFKRVIVQNSQLLAPNVSSSDRISWMTKFDGNILNVVDTSKVADAYDYLSTSGWLLSIANADSGWGDSYTPTLDEIKAYFMGWKMYAADRASTYNGAGTKYWYPITRILDTLDLTYRIDTTAPTTTANNKEGYAPYQLLYQLATPTVEPITSEGQLTLVEGSNQVEVSTGIVLRESNKPGYVNGIYYFNDTYYGSPLKYKVDKVMVVYKNNVRDYKAVIYVGTNQYGNQKANLKAENYDPTATYSISYLMLDASPIASFVGSVPDNEKALLTDLVQDVQEASARLSVVENKKAEKDVPVPAWITPTLLNSWVRHSTARPTLRYYKDSQGVVHLEGVIRSGVVTSGTSLCNLPAGYRPALTVSCVSYSSNGSAVGVGLIDVLNDGTIQLGTTGTPTFYNGLMFIALSFLAEQ